jgi:phosphatidylserine/phosphatidylglycerophosphate/cardiolipin synthase-like enzyme
MHSHEGLDQIHSSLAIDVTEACCECPMKYGNDLSAPLVEEIPLLPRVLREVDDVHHFQWFEIDFTPLIVKENALVLLGGQFQ